MTKHINSSDLPPEMYVRVLEAAPITQVVLCRLVCRQWQSLISSTPSLSLKSRVGSAMKVLVSSMNDLVSRGASIGQHLCNFASALTLTHPDLALRLVQELAEDPQFESIKKALISTEVAILVGLAKKRNSYSHLALAKQPAPLAQDTIWSWRQIVEAEISFDPEEAKRSAAHQDEAERCYSLFKIAMAEGEKDAARGLQTLASARPLLTTGNLDYVISAVEAYLRP